ncbi:MAG: D-2-hydroxyacid dehydrogenase [Desulfuromonadales bacterium]|nr:D-2-hydroxyacid dehydrogenase [Desulfuromonadales bacterium]
MKIVVLDGYTLNPGDLTWAPLEALGELTVHERTAPDQLLARAAGAPLVLINKVFLDAATIGALPQLRYLGVLATGYNVVDLEAARQRGVVVTNVPAYSTASVAQMVFALLLELTQQVGHHAHLSRWGQWSECPDFSFWDRPLIELDGLTLGIIGFGAIGRRVARIGQAMGMAINVHTPHPQRHAAEAAQVGATFVELDDLFRTSDVITLHCPLTADTRQMVNEARLRMMKPSAYLINTGRGPLVDEEALALALKQKRLAGAGLDVLCQEPPPVSHPLLTAPNCFVTPHIAWATRAARQRLLATAATNIEAFLAGAPQNVVSR